MRRAAWLLTAAATLSACGEAASPALREYAPDGTYLGRVELDAELTRWVEPVFDGDRVWAVVRDALDVQYVTRFRITFEGTENSTE